jgi:hypothetical protein
MTRTAFTAVTLTVSVAWAAATAEYKRLSPSCKTCGEIEQVTKQHNTETSADKRLQLALKLAKIIQGIDLKGKSETEQKRELYFAMNASLQVLPDDFDSETVVRLLDLRQRSPKIFDEVLWRFPLGEQQKLVMRMRAFIEDKVRPNAKLPTPKEVE